MNRNLMALTASAVLGISLSVSVLAQSNKIDSLTPNVLTQQPAPSPLPSNRPPIPDGPPPGSRPRPDAPPGGLPQGVPSRPVQGFSASFSFQEALEDAISKARQASGVNSNNSLNFRVLEITGVAAGGNQNSNQLQVTIVVIPPNSVPPSSGQPRPGQLPTPGNQTSPDVPPVSPPR